MCTDFPGAEKAKTVFSPINAHRTTVTEAAAPIQLIDVIVEAEAMKDGEDQSLEAATANTRHSGVAEAEKYDKCLHHVGVVYKSCPVASTNLGATACGNGRPTYLHSWTRRCLMRNDIRTCKYVQDATGASRSSSSAFAG